jgi:hypothetical protein
LTLRTAIIGTVLLVAACSPNVPPASPPVVQQRPPPDWFHQQLAAAREAKRAHQPASDVAGAQKAYDDVVVAACIRLALTGSTKYAAHCTLVLQLAVSSSHFILPDCDDPDVDSAMLLACND